MPTLPYQSHSATSQQAATAAAPRAPTQRALVYKLLVSTHNRGMTDEEMQDALGMNPSTQRPRRIELVERGLVCDSGLRRRTRSSRWAVVWAVTKYPPPGAVP